jgi:TonB-linked SusC/RagA family outer membrane protein
MIYPTIPLTDPSLTDPTETDQGFSLYSPTVSVRDNDQISSRSKLNLGAALTYEFIDNFKLKSEVGMDIDNENRDRFYGMSTGYSQKDVPGNNNKFKPALIYTGRDRNTIRNTNTLQMNFKQWMPKDHTLSAVLGQEVFITTSTQYSTEIGGFDPSFDLDMARRLSSQGKAGEYNPVVNNRFDPDDKMVSFFGRANYDYQSKYLFSATFRADGSSKFSRGNRWGYFPSASAAWRMSSEKFMKGTEKWLYDLKLRASIGSVGNNGIPGGQMSQDLTSRPTTWVGGYSSYWGPADRMANPDLTWETTITRNLGVDFSMLEGRLNGTIEVYQNNTKDLLLEFDASAAGYKTQFRNAGETQNKGLEISGNYIIFDNKNFGLTFGANIGFNKNEVKSLGGMRQIIGQTGWASTEIADDYIVNIGQPIGQMVGYKVIGRYEVDDFNYTNGQWELKEGVVDGENVLGDLRPGMMKLEGKQVWNEEEGKYELIVQDNIAGKDVIGNANPLHTGGFYINARAYGFDLSTNFNWSYGNDIYNANKIEYTQTSKYKFRNMIDIMEMGERWTNIDYATGQMIEDPDALAQANANTTMWSPKMQKHVLTDWAVEDGSFLRLNTLTLGYTIPQNITQRIKIQTVRFYATAYNVWLWTNYSGFDPEVDTRRKVPYTHGVDWAAYPRSRQIVFGANITF